MRLQTPVRALAAALVCAFALGGCSSDGGIVQPQPNVPAASAAKAGQFNAVTNPGLNDVADYTFSRQRGTPRVERVTVNTPSGYFPEAVLRIVNGDSDGAHRVSSAIVAWNGQVVLGPNAFSQQTDSVDVPVRFGADPSTLAVRLAGKPGGAITARILGRTTEILTFAGGKVTLTVPYGAAPVGTDFTATPAGSLDGVAPPVPGTAFEFGPHGTWAKNLTVSIAYDPTKLPAGVHENGLGLFWYDGTARQWRSLADVRVDASAHRASGDIGHFTTIAVVPDTVRVCPSDPTAAPTLEQGLGTVADGGTVLLCNASHPASNVGITHSVTIEPDGTGFSPTLQGDGSGVNLYMESAGASLTLEHLHFAGAGASNVRLTGTEGNITVHGSSFDVAANNGASGVNALGVTGGTLLVQRDTFAGGGFGVNAEGGDPLHVYDNRFTGQIVAPIQLSSGANGEITGNTTGGCGQQCVALYGAGSTSITYNVFKAEPDGTTQYGVLAGGGGPVTIDHDTFDRNSGDAPQMVFTVAAVQLQDVPVAHIDSNDFYAGARGISVARPNPASTDVLDVFSNDFGQNNDAVVVEGSPDAHLSDNKFLDNHGVAIAFRGNASGVIGGSEIRGCGPEACVELQEAGTVTFTTNLVLPSVDSPTGLALDVRNTVANVVSNSMDGDLEGSATDPNTWPMHDAVIRLENADGSTVTNNDIYRGYRGVVVAGSASNITMQDNRIGQEAIALEADGGSPTLSITRNDVTDYQVNSLAGSGWTSGSATCDWWGATSGPTLVAAGIGGSVYTPYASAPIARTTNPCP